MKTAMLLVLSVLVFSQVGCGYFTGEASTEELVITDEMINTVCTEKTNNAIGLATDVVLNATKLSDSEVWAKLYKSYSITNLSGILDISWKKLVRPAYQTTLENWDKYPVEYLKLEFMCDVSDAIDTFLNSNVHRLTIHSVEATYIRCHVSRIFDDMIEPSIRKFKLKTN